MWELNPGTGIKGTRLLVGQRGQFGKFIRFVNSPVWPDLCRGWGWGMRLQKQPEYEAFPPLYHLALWKRNH